MNTLSVINVWVKNLRQKILMDSFKNRIFRAARPTSFTIFDGTAAQAGPYLYNF